MRSIGQCEHRCETQGGPISSKGDILSREKNPQLDYVTEWIGICYLLLCAIQCMTNCQDLEKQGEPCPGAHLKVNFMYNMRETCKTRTNIGRLY